MADAPIEIGRYVLYGEIASGGMAKVHFGRLVGTGGFAKTVAIKRLHRRFAGEPAFRTMILEEGRLAARVRHPNVVPPLDVLGEGGELLLVMEYVHGEALSKLIRAAKALGERVPIEVAVAIMQNVLLGLHAAHEAKDEAGVPLGIVHRDVSPQNVIVGVDGVARVIDFGIAKAVTSEGENTSSGMIKGKVPYIAPEQLKGEPATRLADVYAAGVVFWELLVGHRLFDGEDPQALAKIVTMKVEPPSRFNPEVPAALDAIILRAVQRDPRARFPTARDMAIELESAARLGTSTVIGAWTERLAAKALTTRAAMLADVEATSAAATDAWEATTTLHHRGRPEDAGGSAASAPAPAPPAIQQRTVPLARPLPPRPAHPPPAPDPGAGTLLPAAGVLRKPALEIANVAWLDPPPPAPGSGSLGKRVAAYAGITFLALLFVAWICAPFIVKKWLVARALEENVVLVIERVEVSRRAITLIHVTATSREVPDAVAKAQSVVVGLKMLSPSTMEFQEIDVTFEGHSSDVSSAMAQLRRVHPAAIASATKDLTSVAVTSGHAEWKSAFGENTSLLFENITFDMSVKEKRALGDDYRFSAPLVTMTVGIEKAGPYALDAERAAAVTRSTLRLDPTGASGSTVSWTSVDDGSLGVTFAVPPTSLRDLHLPQSFVPGSTDKTRVELRGEMAIVAGPARSTTGRVVAGFSDLAAPTGGAPFTVGLDIPMSGDQSKPIPLVGLVTVGQADPPSPASGTGQLTGTIDLTKREPVLQLAGKTSGLPCPRGGELTVTLTATSGRLDQTGVRFDSMCRTTPTPPLRGGR